MQTKLYNPFLEATCNVFQVMLDLSVISDDPVSEFQYPEEVKISIGVIGDLTGEVIYRFPHETSLNMVAILSGMEMDKVDDFVTSAISEIANIISGNVLTILSESDYQCDILPPVLSKGNTDVEYAMNMGRCIKTAAGEICIEIRLNAVS